MNKTNHGGQLIRLINEVDHIIADSVDNGAYPMLDAVFVSDVLKALVRGDMTFNPDRERIKRRLSRVRYGNLVVAAPDVAWEPARASEEQE